MQDNINSLTTYMKKYNSLFKIMYPAVVMTVLIACSEDEKKSDGKTDLELSIVY